MSNPRRSSYLLILSDHFESRLVVKKQIIKMITKSSEMFHGDVGHIFPTGFHTVTSWQSEQVELSSPSINNDPGDEDAVASLQY